MAGQPFEEIHGENDPLAGTVVGRKPAAADGVKIDASFIIKAWGEKKIRLFGTPAGRNHGRKLGHEENTGFGGIRLQARLDLLLAEVQIAVARL